MAASRRGRVFRSESESYVDPATEFEVTRLTSPAYSSFLPSADYRCVSSKRNFLIYASDRAGALQMFRLDFEKDRHRQLTEARNLNPRCLVLFAKDKSFAYIDGATIFRAGTGGGRPRRLHQAGSGWQLGEGLDIDASGLSGAFVETNQNVSRLSLLDVKRRKATTVTEQKGVLSHPMLRPRRRDILYRRNGSELWMVNRDGAGRWRLDTPPGKLGPVHWAYGGAAVHYLSFPEADGPRSIREHRIDEKQDHMVVEVPRLHSFGPNGDSSVFIGVRGGRATPEIALLLPIGRELTISEHGASEEFPVTAVFSPDSRRIVYSSDRDGKPAIYTMMVDDLVEATDS